MPCAPLSATFSGSSHAQNHLHLGHAAFVMLCGQMLISKVNVGRPDLPWRTGGKSRILSPYFSKSETSFFSSRSASIEMHCSFIHRLSGINPAASLN
jgi:hypothetical protein